MRHPGKDEQSVGCVGLEFKVHTFKSPANM